MAVIAVALDFQLGNRVRKKSQTKKPNDVQHGIPDHLRHSVIIALIETQYLSSIHAVTRVLQ